MSYKANHTDLANYGSIVVEDKSINNDTSLSLIGKLYPGYSKYVAENFLQLLENFASFQSPENPVIGQLWWDTDSSNINPEPKLMVWNGATWISAGSVTKSITAPSAIIGDLWVDITTKTLKMFTGVTTSNPDGWVVFNADFDPSTGTGVSTAPLSNHEAITMYVNGQAVAVFSTASPYQYAGFGNEFDEIKPGLNVAKSFTVTGTADVALSLKSGSTTLHATDFFRLNSTNISTGNIIVTNSNGIEIKSPLDPTNKQIKIYPDINNVAISSKSDIKIVARSTSSSPLNFFLSDTGATLNKKLTISNDLDVNNLIADTLSSQVSSINTLNLGIAHVSSDLLPIASNTNGKVGSSSLRWGTVYAVNIDAASIGAPTSTITGDLIGTVRGKEALNVDTIFKFTGDVIGSDTLYNIGDGTVNIGNVLSPTAITTKAAITTWNGPDRILIERAGILKSVTMEQVSTAIGTITSIARDPILGIPPGYLLCDGALILRSDYPELYNAIGITFGSTLSTNFQLPTIVDMATDIKYYIFTGKWA